MSENRRNEELTPSTKGGLSRRLSRAPLRLPFLGLLRAGASQLIVLHHLAFYGPLSDIAYPLLPVTIDLLYEYGRYAVQVFFVIGGFLTAKSLSNYAEIGLRALVRVVVRRYQRIGVPYLAALVVAIGANALAGRFMSHPSISPPPSFSDLVAHALFLQHILDVPVITAGIWYLAVDFQLVLLSFFIVALSQFTARGAKRWGHVRPFVLQQAALWPLAVSSLFLFNRDPNLDMWAVYFFGSYFLGMVLQWTLAGKLPRSAFALYVALVTVSLAVEWRPRLIVALAAVLAIFVMAAWGLLERWPQSRTVDYLGRTSYSLFLIHFPICLTVNAVLSHEQLSPAGAVLGMLGAYLLSQVGGVVFYHSIEAPCVRWQVEKR